MTFNLPPQGTLALVVITALIGGIVTLLARRVAEPLMDWILSPGRWLWEGVYRWVAPRNPFSIALRSYRKHVRRSWLTTIENPIGPDLAVPLEHAFAPLRLISSSSEETIDLFQHVSAHDRCVVLGGPGTGKTTLMKSLVVSVINGRTNAELNSLIPVFVVLRKLATQQQTVKQAIIASFADFHFPGADKFVDSILRQGRMLIVLDGLDEVGVNREYVAGQIISFCESDDQLAKRNHVVVTCREYSYRTEDLRSVIKNVVRVEPFANHHMRVFLQGWPNYQGRSALALYGLIQSDSQIRDICRNPLLLTILTGLHLENRNFEFPTSRSLFYKAAIDELMTKRPARREIKQKFQTADKLNVLQRVSLTRLETVKANEDPEELTAEGFREEAKAVFRSDIDLHEFMTELVEVNGIIKPTDDTFHTHYICAHRTIQEYFAANEAGRIRTPEDVVLRFSERPDLIEVLYFYCGMLRNIPQLTDIVEHFVTKHRWLEAARCLLSMTEVPPASQVYLITCELKAQIVSSSEFRSLLEILSSLAQRPEGEFDSARQRCNEAINFLTGGKEPTGASALESALATSPDAAMKVIPGLLKHHSERWQAAAIQLLKDIGTEESLDQLVQLLLSDKKFIRTEAAKALSGLIQTRNKELKDRAALLPDRKDLNVWPLDHVFPASLAIPMAESLVDVEISNPAISLAAQAVSQKESQDKHSRQFLRRWRNVARDIRLRHYWTRAGVIIGQFVLFVPLFLWLVLIATEVWCYGQDKVLVLEIKPMTLHLIERDLMQHVEATANDIVMEVEQQFPLSASGLSRILPWNWLVERVIPENTKSGLNILKRYSNGQFDPYDPEWSRAETWRGVYTLVSDEKFEAFVQANQTLGSNLPVLKGPRYMFFGNWFLAVWIIGVFLSMILLVKVSRTLSRDPRADEPVLRSDVFAERILPGMMMMIYVLLGGSIILFTIYLGCFVLLIALSGLSTLMGKIPWPRNQMIAAVDDLSPLTEMNDRVDASSPRKWPRWAVLIR